MFLVARSEAQPREWAGACMQGFVVEAGGSGLAADGVFNNAYVLATEDSDAARARIAEFNAAFTAWYGDAARPGRTAQFMGGVMSRGQEVGVSSRAIFTAASAGAKL